MDWGELIIDADGTFEEGPERVMDSRDQVLRRKTVTTKNNQITDQITDLKNWSVITDQIMTI